MAAWLSILATALLGAGFYLFGGLTLGAFLSDGPYIALFVLVACVAIRGLIAVLMLLLRSTR